MTAGRLHITQGNVVLDQGAPFVLERGGTLQPVSVRYAMYGEPNAAVDNVVLVCHALSGSAEVHEWWPDLLCGVFNLDSECVICFNVVGSCYGSTGPASVDVRTGEIYGNKFPLVTVRDMVRAQALALRQLGIHRLKAVLGGSIGGMQALQWAIDYPERVERCIAIGSTPLSAMGLALNHLQREAIALDPNWRNGDYEQVPAGGVALARAIAMCSYKSAELLDERHGRAANRKGPSPFTTEGGKFDVAGFLDYQGESFVTRFNPHSYVAITRAMDLWDPARDVGGEAVAFARIKADTTLVGISSDWLFPPGDVKRLAGRISATDARCEYCELVSGHGHDAFLADCDKLSVIVRATLSNSVNANFKSSGDSYASNSGRGSYGCAAEKSA